MVEQRKNHFGYRAVTSMAVANGGRGNGRDVSPGSKFLGMCPPEMVILKKIL